MVLPNPLKLDAVHRFTTQVRKREGNMTIKLSVSIGLASHAPLSPSRLLILCQASSTVACEFRLVCFNLSMASSTIWMTPPRLAKQFRLTRQPYRCLSYSLCLLQQSTQQDALNGRTTHFGFETVDESQKASRGSPSLLMFCFFTFTDG